MIFEWWILFSVKFCGGTSGSSRRRKPVAPQWLNPSWHDDSDDDEVLINGVCVVQNPLNYDKYVKKSIESSFNHPLHKVKLKGKELEAEIKNEESHGNGNGIQQRDGHHGRDENDSGRLRSELDYASENDCSE